MRSKEAIRKECSRAAQFDPQQFRQMCEQARSENLAPPLVPALERLKAQAEELLDAGPWSVMDKAQPGPSGSKRDYLSLSIYHWPNPDTDDGFPYITKDGDVNPDSSRYDRPGLAATVNASDRLAIAYALTGDERFAERSAGLIRNWFLGEETGMNPNLECAQWIPGEPPFNAYRPPRPVSGPGGTFYIAYGGVIEGHVMTILPQTVGLLADSPAWNEEDDTKLKAWFKELYAWLLESTAGRDENNTPNNHATWYCAQVSSYALYAGDPDTARNLLEKRVPELIDEHIEADGGQPVEFRRAIGMTYTHFNLLAFFSCALLGEKVGLDLWNHKTDDGRCFRKALDWIIPYVIGEKEWGKRQIKPFDTAWTASLCSIAARKYGGSFYSNVIEKLPGYPEDHTYRLVYPG